MKMNYCPICGTEAIQKEIGDEGLMPFCPKCQMPLWDYFLTSIICTVVNEDNEVALLRQSYVSTTNYVCVAGHMKSGESAEETVKREVKEEIGQDVNELIYIRSYPYEKKNLLMLGFLAKVKKQDFVLSGEVDSVEWFPIEEAQSKLREGGIAWQLVGEINEKKHAFL
ncbi:MAG: NUDIX domain-containing protein [Lachnospiraceae bacterium]|nr:NUDIX domain-containing protein [Lachnospiraceae bacterium]